MNTPLDDFDGQKVIVRLADNALIGILTRYHADSDEWFVITDEQGQRDYFHVLSVEFIRECKKNG